MVKEYPDVNDHIGGESKYLKAADLGNDEWELTISDVTEDVLREGERSKLILWFKGAKKGLVSNVTNNRSLQSAYGGVGAWIGKPVVLFTVDTNKPDGEATKGIRVKTPKQRKVIGKASENPAQDLADYLDDAIPF